VQYRRPLTTSTTGSLLFTFDSSSFRVGRRALGLQKDGLPGCC
jgi:hypothetical protein